MRETHIVPLTSDLTRMLKSRSSTELTRHTTPTRNGHPRSIFVDDGIDLEIPEQTRGVVGYRRHLATLDLHLVIRS